MLRFLHTIDQWFRSRSRSLTPRPPRKHQSPGARWRFQLEALETREVLTGPIANISTAPLDHLVEHFYDDLLLREADTPGLENNAGALATGAQCGDIVTNLVQSAENRTNTVDEVYHWYLHRASDPLADHWVNYLGSTGKRLPFEARILGSAEYRQNRGAGSDEGFLAALYQDVLHRGVDATGRDNALAALANGVRPSTVAHGVLTSEEATRIRVKDHYWQYLHRLPDEGGLIDWSKALQSGMSDEDVVTGILCSTEYVARTNQPQSDVVRDWNVTGLNLIRDNKTPPPVASRALAMLQVAVYDTLQLIKPSHALYDPDGSISALATPPLAGTSRVGAAAQAAFTVLAGLFPDSRDALESNLANDLANLPQGVALTDAVTLGEQVGKAILNLRSGDKSNDTVPYTPGTNPGDWQPTPPAFAPALLPGWGDVTPFAMTSGDQFRPGGPPALTSATFTDDFNQTKSLGRIDSNTRTADQTNIAFFWADGAGTETPPGHWNTIARDVGAQYRTTLSQNARLFALLDIAEADAGILCWNTKYTYNFWRPVTAIRNADSAGNPDLTADPTWTPLLVTPNFPEYTSGQSTFSGAADAVLSAFFGSKVSFTTFSDGVPGASRSFNSFTDAADEAGQSGIYGGIHFPSANRDGLASGRTLGNFVVDKFLLG
jgi:hypothetical protein